MISNDREKTKRKIIHLAILIASALIIFCIYFALDNSNNTFNDDADGKKQEVVKAPEKEKKNDDIKKDNDQKPIKDNESTLENKSDSLSVDKPKKEFDSKEDIKEKVWVVDKPAWTEEITKYRKEYIGKYVCESEVGIKYFDTNKEASDYQYWCAKNGYLCNYYWDDYAVEVEVPYTEIIHHKEEGHWEYV